MVVFRGGLFLEYEKTRPMARRRRRRPGPPGASQVGILSPKNRNLPRRPEGAFFLVLSPPLAVSRRDSRHRRGHAHKSKKSIPSLTRPQGPRVASPRGEVSQRPPRASQTSARLQRSTDAFLLPPFPVLLTAEPIGEPGADEDEAVEAEAERVPSSTNEPTRSKCVRTFMEESRSPSGTVMDMRSSPVSIADFSTFFASSSFAPSSMLF
mmetsp:Transcript_46128/g.128489  ORF Transcript_46128/g.128489 Transcript_46128/m.128489 type:complete len:209 (-) Transcript_46128:2089-2715(-)